MTRRQSASPNLRPIAPRSERSGGALRAGPRGFAGTLGVALALGCLGALGTGCATTDTEVTVDSLIAWSDYRGAIELASNRLADDPESAEARRDLDRAHVAIRLDRARTANFRGDFEESLMALDEAEEILPGQPEVAAWRMKSTAQLAAKLREVGRASEASGDFEDAFAKFLRADDLDPFGPQAKVGTERVLLRANYREGLGDAYYRDGVRALREFRTAEAVQGLDAALKYQPDDPRLRDRRSEAAGLLAEERLRIGEELERQGLFRAARNEYRLALLIVDDFAPAIEGLERTEVEVQVLDFLDEANRALILDNFDLALIRIERAASITVSQADVVESARTGVVEARLKWLYNDARELESDYSFLAAIEAYERLLEEADGFYDDAISRRDTLLSYIDLAEGFYLEANQATSKEEQLDYLRRIDLIWPTYRDVANRIATLEGD